MSEGWKDRPINVLAQARREVTRQRRRQIAGRSVDTPPNITLGSRPGRVFFVRDPKNYPTYPKHGQFRFSGLAKGYMLRWNLFLTGKTDEVPPSFKEYSKNLEEAIEDSRRVEAAFRTGGRLPGRNQEDE